MTDMRGNFDEVLSEEVYAGVVRRSFSSEQATVTRYTFAPGAAFPVHHHPQEQITLIESGTVEMTVGDRTESLAAGDWSVVSAGVEHGIRAGEQGAEFVAIVIPRRESSSAYTVLEQ